jgi:uncharacterized membrane-anchored protein YjiN (DUF445 family)
LTGWFAMQSEAADLRLRDLRRMRFLATALLALMFFIFLATSLVVQQWPWLAYVRAFAEAGMIGACADWFAVVALFRHPLGIPIPHTAIVPNSKERIGVAIGRFTTNNFLSPKVLATRLREVDIAGWLARWLSDPANANSTGQRIASALPQALRSLPRDDVNAFLTRSVRHGIEAVPAAPLASKILSLFWARGETQALIEQGITRASSALTRNKGTIKLKVSQKSSRFIPKWVDAIIAERIIGGITQLLEEMLQPNHPWRVDLANAIEQLIKDLAEDPEMHARGEQFKAGMLDNPVVIQQINEVWVEIEARLDSPSTASQLSSAIERGLIALGERVADDERLRTAINKWLRVAILRSVAPRRAEIAAFIRQVVENWDTETLVRRIELQVGRDLQYIRINGTVVGGLVGLLIFTVTQWF